MHLKYETVKTLNSAIQSSEFKTVVFWKSIAYIIFKIFTWPTSPRYMFFSYIRGSLNYTFINDSEFLWISICPVLGNNHGPSNHWRTASPESHCVDLDLDETTCFGQREKFQISKHIKPLIVDYNRPFCHIESLGVSQLNSQTCLRKCFFDPLLQ